MFQSARLKLTAWYLLIIMCVSFAFSAVIYTFLSREVERFARVQRLRIERQRTPFSIIPPQNEPEIPYDPDLINETKYRILYTLILINGGIIAIAGGLGYVLAGRTLRPIQEMVDEQHRFIQDASHELRTPLTSLKSSLEVSLRDKHATLKELKQTIRDGIIDTDRLQLLTDALLKLAQYETAGSYIQKEHVLMNDIVNKAVTTIASIAKAKKIHIETTHAAGSIYAHQESMIELLGILLENAIKYSPEGSTVTIDTQEFEKYVHVSVSDQGIGIDPKDQPYIFDRFYRADTARTKNGASGYGLGLSIAKHLAQIHNGTIDVKSELTKGSTFTITIPSV